MTRAGRGMESTGVLEMPGWHDESCCLVINGENNGARVLGVST